MVRKALRLACYMCFSANGVSKEASRQREIAATKEHDVSLLTATENAKKGSLA